MAGFAFPTYYPFFYRKFSPPTFFLWLLLCAQATAQTDIEFVQTYAVDQGLADRVVTDLIQDQRGLIWIGTSNGLSLYDGYSFTNYQKTSQSDKYINNNNISKLGELRNNRIAIRYQHNLEFVDIHNPETGKTQKISFTASNGIHGKVEDVFFQPQQGVWVLSQSRDSIFVQRLDNALPFVTAFAQKKTAPILQKNCRLYVTAANDIWINDSQVGLTCHSEKGELKKRFQRHDFYGQVAEKFVYPAATNFIHEDHTGRLWLAFSQNGGVFLWNEKERNFYLNQELPAEKPMANVWEDAAKNLFFATRSHYARIDHLYCLQANGMVNERNELLRAEPLTSCFYAADFNSFLFMGTYNGLKKVKYKDPRVTNYLDSIPGYWGKTIKGITGDGKGKIYFGREIEYLYELDKATNTIDTIPVIDPATGKRISLFATTQLIYDDDYLWATHFDTIRQEGLIIKLDPKTRKSLLYECRHQIRSMIKGNDEAFWLVHGAVGESAFLSRFDPKKEELTYILNLEQTSLPPFSTPQIVYQSKAGTFWIGTDGGLLKFDEHDRSTKVFNIFSEGKNQLSNEVVIAIYEDAAGMIYLGTYGGGLNILNPKTNEIRVVDQRNGLPNNDVCGIVPDENGNFWLSTFNGLSYWDHITGLSRNFFIEDGFSHNEFNRFAAYKDEDGRYYFGSLNGVSSFTAKELLTSVANQSLCLTRLAKYDSREDQLIETINGLQQLDKIELSPYVTYFELNFTLPNFLYPEKNQYGAWLKGLEKDWVYLGNTPYVRYNTLPAGDYELYLRGSDSGGTANPLVLRIPICVSPIFYKTKWFYGLMALGFSAVLYSLYQYRLQQAIAVERLRTRIASDLHDEVGSIMTRISIGSELLKEGIIEKEDQQQELEKIASDSRRVTGIMRDVVWSIDAREDQVKNLLDRMNEQLEELLSIKGMEYHFRQEGMLPEKVLEVDVRQNIYFIFKEAINNILKHSDASRVEVFMENSSAGFLLRISDNGTTSLNATTDGQGLKNMQMRASRIGGKVAFSKADGFVVTLRRAPLWKTHP